MKRFGQQTYSEMESLQRNGLEINGKKINIEWYFYLNKLKMYMYITQMYQLCACL